MIAERYRKNIDYIFTEELQTILLEKTIGILGCGGQGGYIAEFLARLGVKTIHLWDGDCYETSNLNRQIGCTEKTIGKRKTTVLKNRIQEINSNIEVIEHSFFTGELEVAEYDIVFSAFDDYKEKRKLKSIILEGTPVIDCLNNMIGGEIIIYTPKSIQMFDMAMQKLSINNEQFKNSSLGFCAVYLCAEMACEAVNAMVQYFSKSPHAPIDSIIVIDMYHHKIKKYDLYGEY